jgi:hypothetical protein
MRWLGRLCRHVSDPSFRGDFRAELDALMPSILAKAFAGEL